jgi:hypothetical protein
MMLDRVEHRIGIKPLQQDDRRAELYTCQHGKKPESMHQRQRDYCDLVAIKFHAARGSNDG